ncbi:MAG: hypothetical protein GY861_25585 [bacterium]|nr:hypothetical protein [bacterium]
MPRPRKIGETEENFWLRNETCVICEISPPSDKPDIIPFTISFLGDFTDSVNSLPYRYYKEPKVIWIFPRYGDKDGGTMVEIFGENFINFDQNLRCGFGSEEAQGYFVSSKYMIC